MIELIKGDCIEEMQKLIDRGVKVDMVLTDPPYKTITGGDSGNRPKGMLSGNRKLFKHQNDIHISKWIYLLYELLKTESHCYIFVNSMNMTDFLNESKCAGFKLHNILVWEKNNCNPSQFYMKNCEYVLFLRKGKAKWINNIGESKTVHKFRNIIGKKNHPTEKPVDLLEFYINNSSDYGDIILDPFMGSGSTGVACKNLGRNFIGIEKDDKYFEIAKERILL